MRAQASLTVFSRIGRQPLWGCLLMQLLCCAALYAQEQASPQPVKLGVIQGLTGIAAEDGQNVVRAIRLAAEEINRWNVVDLKLLIEDDGTTASKTVSAFQRLKAVGVDAIIGPTWDITSNAVIPFAAKSKMVLINTSTFPEAINLAQGDGYVFSNASSIEEEVKPFASYITRRNIRSAAILYVSNPWGETQLIRYRLAAEQLRVKLVDEVQSSTIENNDWRAVLPRIKARAPDTVVLLLNKTDIDQIVRQAAELRLDVNFFASKNAQPAFIRSASKGWYEGLCMSYPHEQLQQSRTFRAAFESAYHEPPLIYADNSYDAVKILYQAVLSETGEEGAQRRASGEGVFGSAGCLPLPPRQVPRRGGSVADVYP
jgi:branched-chain amino acid transport system substrate-binding protein